MRQFILSAILVCTACSITISDQKRNSQIASSDQESSNNVPTWTKTLMIFTESASTQTATRQEEITITVTKRPTNTNDPTQAYEYKRIERYNYFGSMCIGYTNRSNLSPDLNWALCVTDNSIFILGIDGNQWEIPFTKTYSQNIDSQQVSAYFWSTDGSYVFISYQNTIALWKVSLENGSIREILISNRIKKSGENAVYNITISPTGEKLVYFNDLERHHYLYILDFTSDKKNKIYIGFGESLGSFIWTPDGKKLIYTFYMFVDSDGIDAQYDQIIYYLELSTLNNIKVYSISHYEYLEIISIANECLVYQTNEGQWKYDFISNTTTKL
jgi:hypothetical protein